MDNFNFNRFVRTFKWCFYEQRGKLLKWTTVAMIVTFAVEMFFVFMLKNKTNDMGSMPAYQAAVEISSTISSLFLMIAVMMANSNIFEWMKTKQKRAAYLTLPATNLERWTSALIFALVVFPVCISMGFVVGDYIRDGIYYVLGKEWMSGTGYLLNVLGIKNNAMEFDLLGLAVTVWSASCYILAGTWFKKGQFVVPTVFIIALMSFLTYLANHYGNEIAEMVVKGVSKGYADTMKYSVISFIFLAAIFNLWLSFRLFKRFQIISTNWTNL
ncbi:MAG: hypothetical protein J5548_06925 [Prevotella sp.]|nr:hypothetical protein [Prevotella sp.]